MINKFFKVALRDFDSVSGRVGVSLELLSGKGFDRLTVLTQAFETLI